MELQEKMEADIRRLVHLAVEALSTSGKAKEADNQPLEAGLSFIGLVLENGERLISGYWAAYEQASVAKRQIPTIKYPDRYSLKTDSNRIEESKSLGEVMNTVPGPTVKREIAKNIVDTLLGGRVSVDVIEKINKEIDLGSVHLQRSKHDHPGRGDGPLRQRDGFLGTWLPKGRGQEGKGRPCRTPGSHC